MGTPSGIPGRKCALYKTNLYIIHPARFILHIAYIVLSAIAQVLLLRRVCAKDGKWQVASVIGRKRAAKKTNTSTSTCRTLNSFAFVMPLRRCGDCQAFALLSICNSVEHNSGKCTTNVRSYDMSTLYYIMLYEIIRQWIIALFFLILNSSILLNIMLMLIALFSSQLHYIVLDSTRR